MTHKQVSNMNKRWIRDYSYRDDVLVPRLVKARSVKDSSRVAIHLLNPTRDELASAFCRAQDDNFPEIVIHTRRTFGKVE